jgi:hypothetical protein
MRQKFSLFLLGCFGPLCLLCAAGAQAQQAAFCDLTLGPRIPAEHLTIPASCEKPDSAIAEPHWQAGSAAAGDASELELTIASIAPAKLEIGQDFTANVRLKNKGSKVTVVPFNTDGEKMMRTSADGSEEKYEVGDVTFRLATGKNHAMPIFITSSGAVFANPEDKSSYLALEPGKWLEMKIHGTVECGVERCLSDVQPDNEGVLTAWWYERVLLHTVKGCQETHDSIKIRELDSAPFPVVVKSSSAMTPSNVAWKR